MNALQYDACGKGGFFYLLLVIFFHIIKATIQ